MIVVAADDRDFAVRLARYCARNPVALGRMEYQEEDSTVTYHSDKPTGPTAGSETIDALEFLARVLSHIPNKGQVLQRYYGWYASRVRGMRRKANKGDEQQPLVTVDPQPEALVEARRRWAELLRRIFEVDPLRRAPLTPPAMPRRDPPVQIDGPVSTTRGRPTPPKQ